MPHTTEISVIRVLVCANTSEELAELEGTVRGSAPGSLQLVGSCLGRSSLPERIEDTNPDVVLEQGQADESNDDDLQPGELLVALVPRVLIVNEAELADALAEMRLSQTGVRGVLPNWSSEWEIRAAIKAAAEGLLVLHPDFAERSLAVPSAPGRRVDPTEHTLSPREHEVLNLLAAGLGNKQIASQLNISEHTVKFHVTSIFNKLNASSRAEAVAIGARRGLILL
jgi:two-component system, NarL family, response regulator YdfI